MSITSDQRRKIFGLAKGLGLQGDEGQANLRAIVFEATGRESIRELTEAQANLVIRRLASLLGMKNQRPSRASAKELWKQRQLAEKIGWSAEQLAAFVRRMAKVDRVEWQTSQDASNVIEGLKKIVAREVHASVHAATDGKAPAPAGGQT